MKYTLLLLLILLTSTLLFNCDCKHTCTNPVPGLNFVNFDSASLNAVIVKEYSNNGKFDGLQFSNVYTNIVYPGTHIAGTDTLPLDHNRIFLDFAADYIIEIAATGKTWYLRNVSTQPVKMNESSCTDGMKYYLNDTLYTIPASSTASNSSELIELSK